MDENIEHLDLSQAPATETAPAADSSNSEVPTDNAPGSEASEPKEESHKEQLPTGVKKRFAALTRQKSTMQDEINALRAQVEAKATPELDRDDYTDDEWMDLQIDKKARALHDEYQKDRDTAKTQKASAAQASQAWNTKISSFAEEMPDYAEKVGALDIEFPVDVLQELSDSDVGPRMAYHLADNPAEAEALLDMTVKQRSKHLLKLEIKCESLGTPQARVPSTTKASPTPQSRGRGRAPVSEASLSMDDWMAARNKKVHG